MNNTLSKSLFEKEIKNKTDLYFRKTKGIISKNKDVKVTYAIFMRRPVIFCPTLAVNWLRKVEKERQTKFEIILEYSEGAWVGAGQPLMLIKGLFSKLVELETIYLQLIGPSSVAAYNAYIMCSKLPKTAFLAMDARHCAGAEMHKLMAYGASVGSNKAKKEKSSKGFIGSSCMHTSSFFDKKDGLGTMPHSLIGYAGSTLKAAKLYYKAYPSDNLTVLVDYFGKEVTDALKVCNHFKKFAESGKLHVRIDTHNSRYLEGLNLEKSYDVLEKFNVKTIRNYRNEEELKWLVGPGVSAAAILYLRRILDKRGWKKVGIVASSGFNALKCSLFGDVKVPVDIIGTGSYIPENWTETYATADIINYDGKEMVKKGREFLLKGSKK